MCLSVHYCRGMPDALEPFTYLRDRRVELRKSRTEIARAAGISKTYYCQIERGRRLARNPEILGAIADAVGVSILELSRHQPVRDPDPDPIEAVAS